MAKRKQTLTPPLIAVSYTPRCSPLKEQGKAQRDKKKGKPKQARVGGSGNLQGLRSWAWLSLRKFRKNWGGRRKLNLFLLRTGFFASQESTKGSFAYTVTRAPDCGAGQSKQASKTSYNLFHKDNSSPSCPPMFPTRSKKIGPLASLKRPFTPQRGI